VLRAYRDLPRSVHVLVLGAFVNRAGAFVLPFLALYVSVRLGLGPGVASLTLGCYGVGSLVGSLAGGQLADRFGRRVVMVGALAGSALMLVALSRFRSAPAVLAATFGLSLVSDMYRPAMQAFIADVVPVEQRAHAFGLNYLAINLGFAVAPFVGGMLAEHSFSLLFYVDAVTSGLFAALIALALPESLPAPTPSQRGQPREGFLAASRRILRHGVFVAFCAALFLVTLCYAQAFATLPLSMNALGIGEKVYGRIIAVNGMMIVAFQLLVTSAVVRFDRTLMMALSAVLVGTGFALNAFAVTWLGLVGAVVVWTIGEMMQSPLVGPIVADLAPTPLRARYMAFSGFAFSGGAALGSVFGGYLFAAWGRVWFWPGVGSAAFLGALVFWGLRRPLRSARG
jgi:MFS family permease